MGESTNLIGKMLKNGQIIRKQPTLLPSYEGVCTIKDKSRLFFGKPVLISVASWVKSKTIKKQRVSAPTLISVKRGNKAEPLGEGEQKETFVSTKPSSFPGRLTLENSNSLYICKRHQPLPSTGVLSLTPGLSLFNSKNTNSRWEQHDTSAEQDPGTPL